MWETLQRLKHLSFPASAHVGLEQLVLYLSQKSTDIPGLGETNDFASQVVDDVIFPAKDGFGKGKHDKKYLALQELQLLEIILKLYKQLDRDESLSGTAFPLFRALCGSSETNESRLRSLRKLISLAVGLRCGKLLDACAAWIQIQGCHTSLARAVAGTLIEDYCVLFQGDSGGLRDLPSASTHMACIFMGTVTGLYGQPGRMKMSMRQVLLERLIPMMTDWVCEDPRVCLVSLFHGQHGKQMDAQRATLWTSPTKPNTQTPIPGLIRWCTQAPLLSGPPQQRSGKIPTTKSEIRTQRRHEAAMATTPANVGSPTTPSAATSGGQEETSHSGPGRGSDSAALLWSRLHLGVLQTLLTFPTLPEASQLEVITLADMRGIVRGVGDLLRARERDSSGSPADPEPMDQDGDPAPHRGAEQVAVDRLVQVLQVAVAKGAFRCSLGDLRSICKHIPDTRLKNIVEREHLSTAPPAMHNAK